MTMLVAAVHSIVLSLVMSPVTLQQTQRSQPRHAHVVSQAIRESRVAPITEPSPGARYRAMKAAGIKFYVGRKKDGLKQLKADLKNVGKRKVVVITGASSGLGLYCVEALHAAAKEDVRHRATPSAQIPVH